MDIYAVRQQLKTCTMNDLPLRVTFYARVSSESDAQLNSLDNQVSFYENLIKENKKWKYIEGYIDEGITAVTTKNRDNFHRMIEDGCKGKFDYIITKEITRFARNTLDSIENTRKLLNHGVAVFFQNDGINTIDEDSELRLTIMSGIAQDESRKLSSRIKFGHQQAIKKKVVNGNSRIYGYKKIKGEKGRLFVDENEAEMIRLLFELYATNNYSMKQIEDILWEKGYRNHNGNKLTHQTMSKIISNPKYKGYYVGNKVRIIDIFTKKQKFLPPEEWVMFKDETGELVPQIVSEELWDKANEVLGERSLDVKRRQNQCNHSNLFTGKIICKNCGVPYYRKDAKDTKGNPCSKWVCSGKIKNGKDSCPSITIYESDLLPILREVFDETNDEAKEMADAYIQMYKNIYTNSNTQKQIKRHESQIQVAEQKRQKLLAYNVEGKLSDDEFLSMSAQCTAEIKDLKEKLIELQSEIDSRKEIEEQVNKIKSVLAEVTEKSQTGIIDKNFVDKYIKHIYVTPHDTSSIEMVIEIFTGECIDKIITNLRGRSGNMVKKMIEKYENDLKSK